jgi:hypothetical protein
LCCSNSVCPHDEFWLWLTDITSNAFLGAANSVDEGHSSYNMFFYHYLKQCFLEYIMEDTKMMSEHPWGIYSNHYMTFGHHKELNTPPYFNISTEVFIFFQSS